MAQNLPPRSSGLVLLESGTSAVLVVLSFFGNAIVVAAVWKNPRLSKTTSAGLFITALAITDLLNAVIPGSLFITTLAKGRMPYGTMLCNIGGCLIPFLTLLSVTTMALIAISRYFCARKPRLCKQFFSKRRSTLYLVFLATVVGLVVWFPVFVGWAKMEFHPLMATCYFHFTTERIEAALTVIVAVMFMAPSFLIIAVSYCFVLRAIRKHNNHMAFSQRLSTQEINLTKTFFILILSFVLLWLPTFSAIVLHRVMPRKTIPRQLALAVPYALLLNTAVHPWIYAATNPFVRKRILKIRKRRKNRIQAENISRELPADAFYVHTHTFKSEVTIELETLS